jgi:hypothetical protein
LPYQKECSIARPASNFFCDSSPQEIGKWTFPSFVGSPSEWSCPVSADRGNASAKRNAAENESVPGRFIGTSGMGGF